MARTDVHSPKSFNPADYEVVSYVDNKPPAPPTGTAVTNAAWEAWKQAQESWRAYVLSYFPDWRTGDGDNDHQSIYTCNHCGHHGIRTVAVTKHIPTGKFLAFGEICAFRAELAGVDEFKALQARKAREAAQKAAELAALQADFHEAHPEVADWLLGDDNGAGRASKHPFLFDMVHTLNRWGSLTEKQVEAVERWMERDAQRAAEQAAKPPVPELVEGRRELSGKIVSTKWVHSDFGGYHGSEVLKMLVELEDGNRVYGSVPEPFQSTAERGMEVKFTAKIEKSRSDEHFGFFSRPSVKKGVAVPT